MFVDNWVFPTRRTTSGNVSSPDPQTPHGMGSEWGQVDFLGELDTVSRFLGIQRRAAQDAY